MSKKNDDTDVCGAIRAACGAKFGVLADSFMCQSVSRINPPKPVTVKFTDTLHQAILALKSHKIGCVVVVDDKGVVCGILSERDIVLKTLEPVVDFKMVKVEEFMTKDPVCESPDATLAYVLNLMSQGGFRHIPIVDDAKCPIGIVSVKNIVDRIVDSFTESIMDFQTN